MKLYCKYCHKSFSPEEGYLSCPQGKGDFHVLIPIFKPRRKRIIKTDLESIPFILFDNFISSNYLLGKKDYKEIVRNVDIGLKKLGMPPFHITPLTNSKELENKLGLSSHTLFIKDETENVTNSHKARHGMANLLYIEALRRIKKEKEKKQLAIYSCGNAALGAAAIAASLGYKLFTFVPETISKEVEKLLIYYGTSVIKIPREQAGGGDPCYNRFQEAITKLGMLPCSCSGPDNWPNIEGGATIFYEMATQIKKEFSGELDTIFVQVGGGALTSAVVYGFNMLKKSGLIKRAPRLICVQTKSCYPLKLAFDKVMALKNNLSIERLMVKVGKEGKKYMKAWDRNVPESLAEGILDDTTYDWLNVIESVIDTEGDVVVVAEKEVEKAYEMVKSLGMNVSATGTAGLAGLLKYIKENKPKKGEKIGLLFTGIDERKSIKNLKNAGKSFILKSSDSIERIL
jgi:threonine synthase